jgi:hypothetical protein
MKKQYIKPELELLKMEQMIMICMSDNYWIDDEEEADEPAY